MSATNIINFGFRVWGVGGSKIIGKTNKNSGYQRDKVEKID
ncbi:MAG: hypothetical protein QNJ68_12485 [Microcoleaceae cyanobacterium MO_207.B10]|nr:hypothetical protein [Microcoleaceae cyanobacterium MO_207.B10]